MINSVSKLIRKEMNRNNLTLCEFQNFLNIEDDDCQTLLWGNPIIDCRTALGLQKMFGIKWREWVDISEKNNEHEITKDDEIDSWKLDSLYLNHLLKKEKRRRKMFRTEKYIKYKGYL